MELSEKEFEIIKHITDDAAMDQRALAHKTGFSLGLTNILIRRLVAKGYVKTRQLNRRKIQYLLTPKGLGEKLQKSYDYALRTINILKVIKGALNTLVSELYRRDKREFIIIGNDELAEITELVLRSTRLPGLEYNRYPALDPKLSQKNGNSVLLFTSDVGHPRLENAVDVLKYLAESQIPY